MANNLKIYAASKEYVYSDDVSYEQSTLRISGGVPNNTASAFAVNTALYLASIVTKTLVDAMMTNSGQSDLTFGITRTEAQLQTDFGTLLSNLSVSKAAQWTTARTFQLKDSDGSHTGATTSVNGSANVQLALPSTIKASLVGTASNASKINNKTFDMEFDSATGTLNITYTE